MGDGDYGADFTAAWRERKAAAEVGCVFSDDRLFRYTLERDFGLLEPVRGPDSRVLFVMLNPSTADEDRDDPTIRRCIGFAKRWGYAGLTICNAFAYRATDPRRLLHAPDPVGPENDHWLRLCACAADLIVVAWGGHQAVTRRADGGVSRADEVRGLLTEHGRVVFCLGRTKHDQPRHPLYVPASQDPEQYTWA